MTYDQIKYEQIKSRLKRGGSQKMVYDQIQSDFIRQKIKQTKWKDRRYIDDLMRLEDLIVNGPTGMAHAMSYRHFQSEYPEEYKAIYFELKPEQAKIVFERERKELEKFKKEEKERIKRNKKRLEEKLEEWLEFGGKP